MKTKKIIKQQRMLFVIKLLAHITSFNFALTFSLLFTKHASWTFFLFVFYLSHLFPLLYVWACMLMCEQCVFSHTLLQMRWHFKGTEGFSLTISLVAKVIVYPPEILSKMQFVPKLWSYKYTRLRNDSLLLTKIGINLKKQATLGIVNIRLMDSANWIRLTFLLGQIYHRHNISEHNINITNNCLDCNTSEIIIFQLPHIYDTLYI